jgi:hypothetical protein
VRPPMGRHAPTVPQVPVHPRGYMVYFNFLRFLWSGRGCPWRSCFRLLLAGEMQYPAGAMAACLVFQVSSTCLLPAMWWILVSSLGSALPCVPNFFI